MGGRQGGPLDLGLLVAGGFQLFQELRWERTCELKMTGVYCQADGQ